MTPGKEKARGNGQVTTGPGSLKRGVTQAQSGGENKPQRILANADRFRPQAEEAARQLIRSWTDYGPKDASLCDPDMLPGILAEVGKGVLNAILCDGLKDFSGVLGYFTGAPDGIRSEFIECCQGNGPRPESCGPLLKIIQQWHREHGKDMLAARLRNALDSGEDTDAIVREYVAIDAESDEKANSRIVEGVLSFPTEVPPELVLLGNAWMRPGDIGTFISSAGNGKSVAMTQGPMAWGLGLPYLGIRPARPLRVLHFTGEDDEVTIGQCREGFLEHSEAITGRQLSLADLAPLDSMLRTEFSREHVGPRFHSHLARLLREHPADLVIINPLLSYIGGEIVACASEWLRAGLMPILQQFDCAALIASHTPKLARDGWENTDDTYSAIGGGEMANIPRTILTLRPTAAEGLSVVKVSKRQTTGWKDAEGNFTTSYFVRRTNDPTRPAWLPVDSDEAQELLDASKDNSGSGKGGKKATVGHVTDALATGDMQRQALIDWLMRECRCSDRPARDAITEATNQGLVRSYTEANPRGGKPLRWFALNREEIQ